MFVDVPLDTTERKKVKRKISRPRRISVPLQPESVIKSASPPRFDEFDEDNEPIVKDGANKSVVSSDDEFVVLDTKTVRCSVL
jgi:hypothetical protein